VLQVQTVVDRFPEIEKNLTAPEGSRYKRENNHFVPDE